MKCDVLLSQMTFQMIVFDVDVFSVPSLSFFFGYETGASFIYEEVF